MRWPATVKSKGTFKVVSALAGWVDKAAVVMTIAAVMDLRTKNRMWVTSFPASKVASHWNLVVKVPWRNRQAFSDAGTSCLYGGTGVVERGEIGADVFLESFAMGAVEIFGEAQGLFEE